MKIALLDDYQDAALRMADWSPLTRRGAQVTAFRDHIHDSAELVKRLQPFDVICLMRERTRITARELDQLPRLKMIANTGTRNAGLHLTHALSRGIVVSGTRGTYNATPELTWALLLALARNIPGEARSVREGGWQTGVGTDLEGRTLGVMGLGNVGAKVARVGLAFGMRVITWSATMTAARAAEHGAVHVDKQAFFGESDYIALCVQLQPATLGIVGAAELALMKPTAFLVNTSRGEVVNEAALIDALRNRRIAGAGLDAHAVEPLPADHPFRSMDRVLATPHIGYVAELTYRRFYEDTVENIAAWMDGKPIRPVTEDVFKAWQS